MQYLNSINDSADQLMSVTMGDGSVSQLEFIYRAAIQRWTVDITHPSLTMYGFNVSQGPNILRQWRNLIPFGMACVSTTGLDPMNIEDFYNATCSIFILSAAEVQMVEAQILSPIPLLNP